MGDIFKRPKVLHGTTVKVKYSEEVTIYIVLNHCELETLREVFLYTHSIKASECEAFGRLISTSLKHGVSPEKIVQQLKGIGGAPGEVSFMDGRKYKSIPDAIAQVIEDHLKTKGTKK